MKPVKTYTYSELRALDQAIGQAMHLRGQKVAFALVKNQRLVRQEIADADKSAPKPPEALAEAMQKFERGKFDILRKYAIGDDRGVIRMNEHIPAERRAECAAEAKAYVDDHRELLEAAEAYEKERNESLEQLAITLDLHTIKLEDLPADIEARVLAGLLPMLEEQ